MTPETGPGFRFGLETEYLLVDAETYRPLWHPDLSFGTLNAALEAIPIGDLPSLRGLEVEPPHRKAMPFVVEGYHLPDPDFNPIDLLPKGVEIRTPVCATIADCLAWQAELLRRLETAMAELGWRPVALSHHPVADNFEGPQNKRRYDYWQWAMRAMTTYGPDVNISVPEHRARRLDASDLFAKVNYYAPALTALTLASPICGGGLWETRGRTGKSYRTHRRSVFGAALELHPEEAGRMEFKTFEMTHRLEDFHAYFLLWLALLLDDGLTGRADDQDRVYDLGQVARDGLEAETVQERAAAVLDRAPDVLVAHAFDPSPLEAFRHRLEIGYLPADEISDMYRREGSLGAMLRLLADRTSLGVVVP
jgi:carboxylate-amine ligase